MVTHVCKEFGWSVEYVLHMPARRFFAMRLETINQERKQRASFLYDLCDVAAIPLCNSNYYEETKKYFREASMDKEERERADRMSRHIFDVNDSKDADRAARALKSVLGGKGMVMGG